MVKKMTTIGPYSVQYTYCNCTETQYRYTVVTAVCIHVCTVPHTYYYNDPDTLYRVFPNESNGLKIDSPLDIFFMHYAYSTCS